MRGVKEDGCYPEVLKKVLLSKEGSGHFPDDKEFIAAYAERDFYRIGGYRYYLYDRLENGDSLEYVNVVENLRDEVFSVEHLMPQTLSSSWLADLGEDHEAIHERWLNSMANLTLTAYNSKYSNRRFVEKRDMEDGFKDSGFRINKYVSLQDVWGEKQLEERDELMREKFLSLWPMISSDFEWSNDVYDEHELDDDFDFSGRKIAAYTFMGSRFTTKNWAEMICGVLSMVYEMDPVVFHKFVPEGSDFPGRYFSWKQDGHPFKVGEGIYFNAGSSTSTKIEALKIIFEAAGLEGSDLSFELYKVKPEVEDDLPTFPKADDVFVGGKVEI
ncbi:HNH endonuclease family protein [Olsenella sp. oral taxon 809]|uniref:HNH endonuclease family protein n=1 Tax=Olsenella sp. oral taxon 809 TaxID=661086 RepID=UPI001E46D827|nr:HNH endonuclease family protein [Olsenella sp. oral taxon 809]